MTIRVDGDDLTIYPDDPTEPDEVRNRLAAKSLVYALARQGDPICAHLLSLMSTLHGGEAYIETMLDYADDDEDDIRPY